MWVIFKVNSPKFCIHANSQGLMQVLLLPRQRNPSWKKKKKGNATKPQLLNMITES